MSKPIRGPGKEADSKKEIEIMISSDHSHEQTPVEVTSAAASLQDENIGVNEMTPPVDESSLKRELYKYALHDQWYPAQSIYDEFPDMVRIPLTATGDTALHVALSANSTTFVKELVNLQLMTPQDLQIPNADGNTAFIIAAVSGSQDFFKIMIERNQTDLLLVPGPDGLLPVHLAASRGLHEIVQDLSSENVLKKMATKDIERLFFMTITSNMYDVATKIFENCPAHLAIARDDQEYLTALHMLARKPSEEFCMQEDKSKEASSGRDHKSILLHKLWSHVERLEYKEILNLITKPSAVLFDAVKSGYFDAVRWILYNNRELLKLRDLDNGRSLLHVAALFGQKRIFDIILKMHTVNPLLRAVDKDCNNVLHLAANHIQEASSSLNPKIRLQGKRVWFKEVEQRVPPELRTMKNSDGKTPKDIFYAKHRRLSNVVKDAAKGYANPGMLLATLVATLVFAAGLTVPGDKNNAWFKVFILANAFALFTSTASVISFLSIFTSFRFTKSDFIITSLHPSLIIGLALLFFSVASMVIAFTAVSFLVFDHKSMWVAYVVASLGFLPILMILMLQFNLLDGLFDFFFGSRYYDLSKSK